MRRILLVDAPAYDFSGYHYRLKQFSRELSAALARSSCHPPCPGHFT